jgi:multidrug efflux pump subunit AcrA (membrane-fusion protein)
MVDFASLEVQVDLPETSLAQVGIGEPAKIFLDAWPEQAYAGRVTRIWPTANRQKGTIELRVGFLQPDDRLRPEMGVRVVFPAPDQPAEPAQEVDADAVWLPAGCVVALDGRDGVFVLDRDVTRFRAVATGTRRGSSVAVREGLTGGERVVLDPPASLTDGARVRVAQ